MKTISQARTFVYYLLKMSTVVVFNGQAIFVGAGICSGRIEAPITQAKKR